MLQGQAQHTENRSPCLALMSGRLRLDGQTWIYEVKPVGAVLGLLRYKFESSLVYVIKSWEDKLAQGLAGPWLKFDADFDRIRDFLKAALPGDRFYLQAVLERSSEGLLVQDYWDDVACAARVELNTLNHTWISWARPYVRLSIKKVATAPMVCMSLQARVLHLSLQK